MLVAVVAAAVAVVGGRTCAEGADDRGSGGAVGTQHADEVLSLTHAGFERTYRVHVPAGFVASVPLGASTGAHTAVAVDDNDGTGPVVGGPKRYPLVIMLHGAGADGAGAERQTGWDRKADHEGFLAVFPDALPPVPGQRPSFTSNPRFWDDGARSTLQHAPVDDVGFLSAMIDDLERRFPIDPERIYMTGFSSGAGMTFHAAVSSLLSKRLAAVAPVAGHFWDGTVTPERAVSALLIFGTADPLNPIEGGTTRSPWGTRSKPKLADTVHAYAEAIGAPDDPAPLESKKSGVKVAAYGPGRNGSVLIVVTVEGLGHRWPAGISDVIPDAEYGKASNRLNGTDAIWKFFAEHVLADRLIAP
jgi:polyhydroxybutyrate depolymerase